MSAAASPPPIPSSNLTANSIAAIRRKYGGVERVADAGRHLRRLARDLRDRRQRRAEDVAVVELRAAAEVAHRLTQLGLDDRVDDDRRTALRAVDDEPQVVDGLDPRVADLLERLLGELGLERGDEPGRGLAGRVGDDVQLYGGGIGRLRRHDIASHQRRQLRCRLCTRLRLISRCFQVDRRHFAHAHSGRGRRTRRAGGARAGAAARRLRGRAAPSDGQQALLSLAGRSVDAIVLDILMPVHGRPRDVPRAPAAWATGRRC